MKKTRHRHVLLRCLRLKFELLASLFMYTPIYVTTSRRPLVPQSSAAPLPAVAAVVIEAAAAAAAAAGCSFSLPSAAAAHRRAGASGVQAVPPGA